MTTTTFEPWTEERVKIELLKMRMRGQPCGGFTWRDREHAAIAYVNNNGALRAYCCVASQFKDVDWPTFIALINGAEALIIED